MNEGTNSKININGLEAKINLDNDPDISISYNYPKYNSSTNITSTASIKSELNDNEKNELYKYFKDFGYHIMPFSNGNYIGDEYYKIDFNNGIYLKLGTSGLEVDVYENDHRVFRTSLSDDLVNKIRGGY